MPKGGIQAARYCLLCVNIDYIATLRRVRGGNEPDLVEAALLCEKSGCDGITVRLSEDRRHIQDRDVFALKQAVHRKFNLEIPLSDEIIDVATKTKPYQITLLPEKREERTTAHGLDIRAHMSRIADTVKLFHEQNILASLSIEPDMEAVELSKECGADFIEIHTRKYCDAVNKTEIDQEIGRIYRAAEHAVKVGIKISAAHGLDYKNLMPVLKARALEQVTIGRSIISRSVFVGLSKAVKEMLEIME